MIASSAQRPGPPQAPRGADRAGDRARRGDDQRHLHPHRHDQIRVRHRVHAGLPHADIVITGKRAIGSGKERGGATVAPSLSDAAGLPCVRSPAWRQDRGGSRITARLVGRDGKVICRRRRSGLAFSVAHGGQHSTAAAHLRRMAVRVRRSRDRRRHGPNPALRGRPGDQRDRAGRRAAASDHRASPRSAGFPRWAARRWRSSTFPSPSSV